MTLRSKALAATAFAAAAVLVPVAPASAHGTCNVYAYAPYKSFTGDAVVGVGEMFCGTTHDPNSYGLTACLYYTPVAPLTDVTVSGDVPLPPTGRPVACTTGAPSSAHPNGGYWYVYTGCPYFAGYYQTYVSDGRAGAPGEHVTLGAKTARSPWVFIDGTACL